MDNNKLERVGVLYSRLSGYMSVCLRALKENHNIRLLVYQWPPEENAPFDEGAFAWIDDLYTKGKESAPEIRAKVEAFQPQALYMSGWMDRDYLKVARALKKRGIPVVGGIDAQWKGTLRQRVGRLIAPWFLHPAIDILWVPGERQRRLARRYGYAGERCWTGCYSCDWASFAKAMTRHEGSRRPFFLYAGRYTEVKGIDLLVEAYGAYRSRNRDPWNLVCAGTGKLVRLLKGREGITDRGFIQPRELPELMAEASAFVLPSLDEPWGVVVHEAAASGLPLLCSDASGAAVHLLQDGYNGYFCETGSARHLALCMTRLSGAGREERLEMSRRSHELSKQFTPERWASTFVQGIASLRSDHHQGA